MIITDEEVESRNIAKEKCHPQEVKKWKTSED